MIDASYVLRQPDLGLAAVTFLREVERRGHRHFATRDLDRHVADAVLGADAVVTYTYDADHRRELIAEAGKALVLLRVWKNDADVCASATTPEAARGAVDAVRARVERLGDERSVEVTFYDGDADNGSRTLALAVRPWAEVAPLYPRAVRTALGALVPHVHDVDEPRRLLIWSGAPGTGKTTAVRALLHAWRSWADGLVVTDPERLLTDGRYLRRVLLDVEDEDRWQLVVLEDAEALLARGAGAALGKMLNLADGLLGQGLRCLFLVTTNEPLTNLHPAVVRPGRCLARIEFGPLSAAEAAQVLGRPVDGPRTLAEILAERAVTATAEPVAVGQYL